MNRKNAILLAVLTNAGLLLILFVTALSTPEDISIAPTHELSSAPKQESPPLFAEELNLVSCNSMPEIAAGSAPLVTPVIHALPPAAVAPTVEAISAPVSPVSSATEVVVKKGDTLEKIAKAHKTTVDEIIKFNHLPSSFLRVGQALKMPSEKSVQVAKVVPKAVESGSDYYIVKVGDNPWTIAMKNHIKVDELLKMNALNEEKARKLKAGDRLRIR